MHKLFIILILSLSIACNPSKPIPQNTIVVGIDTNPQQFDPRLPTDSTSQKINKLLYNGLLTKDQNLNLVPDLAKDFKIADPKTYIFYLRPNVYFHNHKQLTSQDVKATYESMLGDKVNSPFKGNLSIIQSIETPDDHTVIFHLKEPSTPFLTLMSLGILPKDYIDLDGVRKDKQQASLVGTGPYQLDFNTSHLGQIHLIRFDQYFNQKAKTKNLIFRVIQDSTLRSLELIKGRLDMIQNDIPYVLIPALKKQKNLHFLTDTGINFTYMAFNFKNPYLKELNVRKAIAYAIDRKKIIKYKLSKLGRLANSLMSPKHWAYDQSLENYPFDLDKAKELLNQSQFKDPDGDGPLPRFKLIYKTSSVKERIEIAQLIAENLKKIGIDVIVKPYEFGTFYRDIRQGDFDIFTLTWVGLTDFDIYYYVFHSSMVPPNGANRGFYKNEKLSQLLEKSRITMDKTELKNLYNQIQEIVYNDFVYAPLWYENNFVFVNKAIEGYQLRPDASFINLVNAYKN